MSTHTIKCSSLCLRACITPPHPHPSRNTTWSPHTPSPLFPSSSTPFLSRPFAMLTLLVDTLQVSQPCRRSGGSASTSAAGATAPAMRPGRLQGP